jgi:hypothetical protein
MHGTENRLASQVGPASNTPLLGFPLALQPQDMDTDPIHSNHGPTERARRGPG